MSINLYSEEIENSQLFNSSGSQVSFYIGNNKYTFLFKEKVGNLSNASFSFGNQTFIVASFGKDGKFAGFYEKNGYQALQDRDKNVDLALSSAKQVEQFKAYDLIHVDELYMVLTNMVQ